MCNGNRPFHQVGELGISSVSWLVDGGRWLRFCGQSLPTVIDHGREVSFLTFCIKIVIGLAQNSCLLNRTNYFSWLLHIGFTSLLLFSLDNIKFRRLFAIPDSNHGIFWFGVGGPRENFRVAIILHDRPI